MSSRCLTKRRRDMMKKAAPVPAFIEHDSVAYIPQDSEPEAAIDSKKPETQNVIAPHEDHKTDETEAAEIKNSFDPAEEITLNKNLDRVEKELDQLMTEEAEQEEVSESEPVSLVQTEDVEESLQPSQEGAQSSNDDNLEVDEK